MVGGRCGKMVGGRGVRRCNGLMFLYSVIG